METRPVGGAVDELIELLVVLVPGLEPDSRLTRETPVNRTHVVAVPDEKAALSAVRDVAAAEGRLDLVEVYGAGPRLAAAILSAFPDVPVGTASVEFTDNPDARALVVESIGADPAIDRHTFGSGHGRTTLVWVGDAAQTPRVVSELAEAGVRRVVLCGGMGPIPTAAAQDAGGTGVAVSAVLFGFESLAGATAYSEKFGALLAAHGHE